MQISSSLFGNMPDGSAVTCFSLENNHGLTLEMIDYGATVVALRAPDRSGVQNDIVTGYARWEDWLKNEAYFGTTIGRTCNRIGNARFELDGNEYKLTANQGKHQLHGGLIGFNSKLWTVETKQNENSISLIFKTSSQHLEEGFPGNLQVQACYTLDNQNIISMKFEATTDAPTPVNLTNHTYFNLGGHDSGTIYNHQVLIFADYMTETDKDSIPTGKLLSVKQTPFDFTQVHPIGERIGALEFGYDDNYALNSFSNDCEPAARVFCPESGRVLDILTTEPGIQFYTANWFNNIAGKNGHFYQKHEAFALETQHYPDSMNHPEFPNVILRPDQTYKSETRWRFSVANSIND